jgi:LmbE family N-acetylglucosaminyl deacetylase
MPNPSTPLLAFGAHPDDIEFGCGGVIAAETAAGRRARFVVCSKGESATRGTPAVRAREARNAARILGASIEFAHLGGDAHFDVQTRHVLTLAKLIRRHRPALVLAPSLEGNQHPDHAKLGLMVRDALRIARYGGVRELRALKPHACGALFWYAVTTEAEPAGNRVLIDVSPPAILETWRRAMEAHASQMATRNYVELQLTRARLNGLRSGTGHAIALFPADAPLLDSLAPLTRSARQF